MPHSKEIDSNPRAGAEPLSGRSAGPLQTGFIWTAALLLLCLRRPLYLLNGYIYAEEARVYFRFAWESTPLRALVAPHQFYYSLYANLCGILAARILPLAAAAHALFWCEILIQMLLVTALIQCETLESFAAKAIAASVALLCSPGSAIEYSTINAQFYLALLAAVVLISYPERHRAWRIFLVGFAGLSGIPACALLPVFAIAALRARTRARLLQLSALGLATLVQAAAVLVSSRGQLSAATGGQRSPALLAGALLANGPLAQFFTFHSTQAACRAVGSPRLAAVQPLFWTAVVLAALFVLALAGWFALRSPSRSARLLMACCGLELALGLVRAGSSMDFMCGSGGRYFFVPNVLLALALVAHLQRTVRQPGSKSQVLICRVLLAACIISGVLDLLHLPSGEGTPVWSAEVARWRCDPSYRLQVLPSSWPGLRLSSTPGQNPFLPADFYDTTTPGWQQR